MKKFFKSHPEAILIALTFVLAGILGTYFFWGGKVLLTSLNMSLKIPSDEEITVGFDLESARALNLKLEQ